MSGFCCFSSGSCSGFRSGPGDKRGFHWTLKRRRIHPGLNVSEKLNAFLLVYMGLFPIINPIGGAPIFLGLTRHCTDEERHSLARRVAINGFF